MIEIDGSCWLLNAVNKKERCVVRQGKIYGTIRAGENGTTRTAQRTA
jgi:hypothetical protein